MTIKIEGSLYDLFEDQAKSRPGSTALVVDEVSWTYGALRNRARELANAIGAAASSVPERVAIVGRRSADAYAGILASLLLGATYVPLSTSVPPQRLRRLLIAADPQVVILVGHPGLLTGVFDGRRSAPSIVVASSVPSGTDADPPERTDQTGDRPAYLMFTSGTTGTPKGVPVGQTAVRWFLRDAVERFSLTPDDRLTQNFEHTFDLSVFDLFAAWASGAATVSLSVKDRLDPAATLERHGVSVWFSVPQVATSLLDRGLLRPGSLPTLRRSLFCGDVLRARVADAWAAAAPLSTVDNLYGPTELTIACSAYRHRPGTQYPPAARGLVPIGPLLPGSEYVLVDERDEPVEPDTPGLLCVSGPQLFEGYWRDADATDRATLIRGGRRYHRTGDRVVDLGDGIMAYHGRDDEQVKHLGYRIDLREVENAVRAHHGVHDAAVLPRREPWGEVVAIEAVASGSGVDASALAAALRAELPSYAVPRRVVMVDEVPRNTNGKVDRASVRSILDAGS